MKIGLISDIHAKPIPLKNALKIFEEKKVDVIYNMGDTAGYFEELEECVRILQDNNILTILGNHDQWYIDLTNDLQSEWVADYLKSLITDYSFSTDELTIQLNHEAPLGTDIKGIKLLDKDGVLIPESIAKWEVLLKDFKADILIVGHTHQVFAEIIGNTFVINPGSTVFNNSCAILTIPNKNIQFYELSEAGIQSTWNWSLINRS